MPQNKELEKKKSGMVSVVQKTEQHSDQFCFLSGITILLHNPTGLFRQKSNLWSVSI